jgi:hypothetical protein
MLSLSALACCFIVPTALTRFCLQMPMQQMPMQQMPMQQMPMQQMPMQQMPAPVFMGSA